MTEFCPQCRIPTSSHKELRWCLYCDFAVGKEGRLVRVRIVRHINNTSQACIGSGVVHANVYFNGDRNDGPDKVTYKINGCDIIFNKSIGGRFQIDVFRRKGE